VTRISEAVRARIAALTSVVSVMRFYASLGLVMVGVLMALSLWYFKDERAKWIVRSAGMGCTLGALVALNVMNRLIVGQTGAFVAFTVGLVGVALGLAVMSFVAHRHALQGSWAPLVASVYLVILARILLRFRATRVWDKRSRPTPG
jgi:hypothetical protein